MRFIVFIALLAATLTQPARAKDCSDAASQKEMTDCAKQNYARNDARLNASYAQLRLRLTGDAERENQLIAAQRAWIAYRDTECAFSASGVAGGSLYGVVHTTCLNRLTAERNNDLTRYLNCQEGDLSCPAPKP